MWRRESMRQQSNERERKEKRKKKKEKRFTAAVLRLSFLIYFMVLKLRFACAPADGTPGQHSASSLTDPFFSSSHSGESFLFFFYSQIIAKKSFFFLKSSDSNVTVILARARHSLSARALSLSLCMWNAWRILITELIARFFIRIFDLLPVFSLFWPPFGDNHACAH